MRLNQNLFYHKHYLLHNNTKLSELGRQKRKTDCLVYSILCQSFLSALRKSMIYGAPWYSQVNSITTQEGKF